LRDEGGTRRFVLELTGAQKGVLIAGIEGVDDRNAAERLKGLRLYVSRDALPTPEEGEFYEADLIGLTASREDGSVFGIVRGVNDFGAGASLEIEDQAGQTLLVPFTSAAVPVVDIANKRVVVVPPTVLESASRESDDAADDETGEG
jgi:16S rRNA processing protein RimM